MSFADGPRFRTGHYNGNGALTRASYAFPTPDVPDPQAVADRCARAADASCEHTAGTFLVWADHQIEPDQRIELADGADARKAYGADRAEERR